MGTDYTDYVPAGEAFDILKVNLRASVRLAQAVADSMEHSHPEAYKEFCEHAVFPLMIVEEKLASLPSPELN